jgi:hypothetical protein
MRLGILLATVAAGCRPSLPEPPLAPSAAEDVLDVTYPPPAAHVEDVPEKPQADAVWVDGQWTWEGKWRWNRGGWVIVPNGARFAPWRTFRRIDGTLAFVPSSWRDARGALVPSPPFLVGAPPARSGGAQEPEANSEEQR